MLKSSRAGVVLPAGLGCGAAGLGWQKGREISGSDGKVPPCGADTANVPPLSIRQDRRKPGCGGAGVEHGSRTTESATAPHLRVRRRSQFAGFAATLAPQGSSPFSIRRQGGESAERAKKSLPATLIARKPLQRGRSKAEGTRIRQARRSPEGTRMRPGGGTNVDGRIRRDKASPRLQHRRDGGKNAEQSKKSLLGRLIARKPLHRGGGEGRHR